LRIFFGKYWSAILPLTAIAKSQQEKIRRFREQQFWHRLQKIKAQLMPGALTGRLSCRRSETGQANRLKRNLGVALCAPH
jgi:hypothetical protein